MSKQTNDKDEHKVPSGQEQSVKGRKGKASRKGTTSTKADAQAPGSAVTAAPLAASLAADEKERAASSAPVVADPAAADPVAADKSSDTPDKRQASSAAAKPTPDKSGTADSAAKPTPDKSGTADSAAKPTSDKPSTPASAASKAGGAKAGVAPTQAAAGGSAAPPPSAAATEGGGGGRGKRGIGVLALILVLLLGIGAGLFAWNAWERLDAQQQRLAELETQTTSAADDVVELSDQLEQGEQARDAEVAAALDTLQGEFASYRGEVDEALDQVLDELSREQETDSREWLHAEAAYLLRLANQRLQLERDVDGAAALLSTADARLNEADNPALLSIRRAIAAELSILESVPQVDRTGLYLTLNAQQERLAQLPLSRELEEIPARSGIEEAPSGGWQDQLSRFGQELKELVVIRHHDEALEGLIAPEQESYLRQSARLVLEQAQLALLKEEQGLYEASLDKAVALIEGYYDTESSEVQAVIERLQALKGENIQPELPDISGSQQALAEFIERRFGSRSDQGDEE